MCLFLKEGDSKLKTAQEDIVCWKWLCLYKDGTLRSPYQWKIYNFGSEMIDTEKTDRKKCEHSGDMAGFSHNVSRGGLHTFKNEEDAKKVVLDESTMFFSHSYPPYKPVAVKCIIPKGTKYYEGYFQTWGYEGFLESYASKKLIVTDEFYSKYSMDDDEWFEETVPW